LINIDDLFDTILNEPFVAELNVSDKDYGYNYKKGDIIIESSSDNSIPWRLQEDISDVFNAVRHHLG
jgi:hypothetical protein